MRFDQRLADGQSQSQPAELPGHARVALFEGGKYPVHLPGRDPHAGVDDCHLQLALRGVAGVDSYAASRRGELDGVVEQVPEHLLEPGGVGPGRMLPGGQFAHE